jgi:hypothetical protein
VISWFSQFCFSKSELYRYAAGSEGSGPGGKSGMGGLGGGGIELTVEALEKAANEVGAVQVGFSSPVACKGLVFLPLSL